MLKFLMMSGAVVGLVGAVRSFGKSRDEAPAEPIRVAGTESMANPPLDWDMTDETSDESFPASDPPGNY